MHLTRAIPYIAFTLFAHKSSRKCHIVRTFGLTAVTKVEEEKDDGNKEEEEEKEKNDGEQVRMCAKEERDRKRAVREEFETLDGSEEKRGRW